MKPPITLFEHEYTDGFDWTIKQVEQIEAFNKAQGDTILHPGFRNKKRELKAQQYVGVVRVANRTIQILPKIFRSHQSREEVIKEATENLLYLLSYAGRFPIRENEVTSLSKQHSDWFEILTRIFARHLIDEWEKGAVRNYQNIEERLPVLKGKWLVNRQFARPAARHLFDVSFDEFSVDNKLNRVFRFVVERLWKISRDYKNRQMLGDLRMMMDEVTLMPSIAVNEASPALLNRTNSRFSPLLNMSRMFLDNGVFRLSTGATDSYAFVFDMNALFESFLVEFIRRNRSRILPDDLSECELLPQTKGAVRHLLRHENKKLFQMKPDLAFRDADKEFPLLLDAKYKVLKREDARFGVSQSDIYQMLAYSVRYGSERILLVYPENSKLGGNLVKDFRIEDSEAIIRVACIGLNLRLSNPSDRAKLAAELENIFDFNEKTAIYGDQKQRSLA